MDDAGDIEEDIDRPDRIAQRKDRGRVGHVERAAVAAVEPG